MGRIGKQVARKARAFDMKVVYHNRSRLSSAEETSHAADYRSLEDLCREADVICTLTPHTKDTHHIIGEPQFELMKGAPARLHQLQLGEEKKERAKTQTGCSSSTPREDRSSMNPP